MYAALIDWLNHRPYLLAVLSGVLLLGCIGYCLILWVPPPVRVLIMPDIGVLCGLYCGQRLPYLAWLTVSAGMLMLAAAYLMYRGYNRLGGALAVISGVFILPVGLLGFLAAYFAWQAPK